MFQGLTGSLSMSTTSTVLTDGLYLPPTVLPLVLAVIIVAAIAIGTKILTKKKVPDTDVV
ncbi:MAG: hypothetical protein C4K48_03510 [Candidatus Thorarchaeota archaeon]|nr:MAG: hypothetical protein C4K48_03510 [Candidatus Thorarchaeota archaeon]